MTSLGALNATFQWGGDRDMIREAAADVDVLALVECRDRAGDPVDVQAILGPEWMVWQDLRDGARSGSALAVRVSSGIAPAPRRRRGRPAAEHVQLSSGNSEVQARFAWVVRLRDRRRRRGRRVFTVIVGHPPLRSSGKQGEAVSSLRRVWASTLGLKVFLGDGNMLSPVLASRVGAANNDGGQGHPMVALWGRGLGRVAVTYRWLKGADHKRLRVVLP